jgi:hypothetical protein
MSNFPTGDGPEDRDDSWANETLPLGIRRELLTRDLQKAYGRRNHPKGEASPPSDNASSSSDEHPKAQD